MSEGKQNRFLPYLREDRLPHIFCPGCGNGAIINAFLAAICSASFLVLAAPVPSTIPSTTTFIVNTLSYSFLSF